MLSEFTKFSKVSMALLCSLMALFTASSYVELDFVTGILIKALVFTLIIVLLNFEFWLIHSNEPNYQQLLEELKEEND